jgi:hypothetical protein
MMRLEALAERRLEALIDRCPFDDIKSNLLLEQLKEQMLTHWPKQPRQLLDSETSSSNSNSNSNSNSSSSSSSSSSSGGDDGEGVAQTRYRIQVQHNQGFASPAIIRVIEHTLRQATRNLLSSSEVIMSCLNIATVMMIREQQVAATGILLREQLQAFERGTLATLVDEHARAMASNGRLLASEDARQQQADAMVEYGFPRLSASEVEEVVQKQRTTLLLMQASVDRIVQLVASKLAV